MEVGMVIREPVGPNEKEFCVYVLRCPHTNDMKYVGSTWKPESRYQQHIGESRRGSTRKNKWIHSVLKSGAFPVLEIVAVGEYHDMVRREREIYDANHDKLLNDRPPCAKPSPLWEPSDRRKPEWYLSRYAYH